MTDTSIVLQLRDPFQPKEAPDSLYAVHRSGQNPGMISRRLLFPAADPGPALEKFEDLLARLEQIVADLENAELPLEKLLGSYEEGMRLVKACGDRLADAEQKVEILSRSISAEPPKPAAPAGEPAPAKSGEDIRLF